MLARRDRLSTMGVRRSRRLGTDNEFERLRDHQVGDDPRHVDWRATGRRRKLTCRAYQLNQSQRIIFLIDCGRLMAGDTGDGLSPLDHAFNAMLLLAHVALIRGDQVGLLAYSDRVRAYVAPGGGPRRINRIVHSVHNVFPELVESRHDRAFLELERRCRKRSLVVMMTNLFDELNAQMVGEYLGNMTGRHLPLGVFLRDHDLFAHGRQCPRAGAGTLRRRGRGGAPELAGAGAGAAANQGGFDTRCFPAGTDGIAGQSLSRDQGAALALIASSLVSRPFLQGVIVHGPFLDSSAGGRRS